jgi:hypothetical protein
MSVDGWIILKWIVLKYDKEWPRLIWLMIGTGGGLS